MTITEAQVQRAKYLRSCGMGWAALSKHMGISQWTLTKVLDPDAFKTKVAKNKEYQAGLRILNRREVFGKVVSETKTVAPPEIEAERDRAYSSELSPNIYYLGDPLPGRSALDKKLCKSLQY